MPTVTSPLLGAISLIPMALQILRQSSFFLHVSHYVRRCLQALEMDLMALQLAQGQCHPSVHTCFQSSHTHCRLCCSSANHLVLPLILCLIHRGGFVSLWMSRKNKPWGLWGGVRSAQADSTSPALVREAWVSSPGQLTCQQTYGSLLLHPDCWSCIEQIMLHSECLSSL